MKGSLIKAWQIKLITLVSVANLCVVYAEAESLEPDIPLELTELRSAYLEKLSETDAPHIGNALAELLDLEKGLASSKRLEAALIVRERRSADKLRTATLKELSTPTSVVELDRILRVLARRLETSRAPVERIYDNELAKLALRLREADRDKDAIAIDGVIRDRRDSRDSRMSFRFEEPKIPSGDVALASAGASAKAPGGGAEYLIDGFSEDYSGSRGFGWGTIPCDLIVELKEVYSIGEIRFLLHSLDGSRRYSYRLYVSPDEKSEWHLIVDNSENPKGGWQEKRFKRRPVKKIRIEGLDHSSNREFHVVEIEAR